MICLFSFCGSYIVKKWFMSLYSGTIASNQTICYNGNPAAFTSVADASGGTTGYTYQWQYVTGSTGGTWVNIAGATGTTYDSGTLTTTRWFRRRVIDSGVPPETGYTNTLEVTVRSALYAGIIATGQLVKSGNIPDLLTSTANASGSTGTYSYQWLSGTTSTPNTEISAATGTTYQPPALTQTTYYRRRVIDACSTGYTNTVRLTVGSRFVYAVGDFNQSIVAYDYDNLTIVLTGSTTFTSTSNNYKKYIAVDDNYLYVITQTGNIGKYNKHDLSLVTKKTSFSYISRTFSIDSSFFIYIDGDYLYLHVISYASPTYRAIIKIDKDLNPVAVSPSLTNQINIFTKFDGYFFGMNDAKKIVQFSEDLSAVNTLINFTGNDGVGFNVDENNIYTQGTTNQLYKWDYSDNLILSGNTAVLPHRMLTVTPPHITDKFYLVEIISSFFRITAHAKSNLARVLTSSNFYNSSSPHDLWLINDNDYIYIYGKQYYNTIYSRIDRQSWSLNSVKVSEPYSNNARYFITSIAIDALNAGFIASAQTICENTAPSALTTILAPSRGISGYTYQWLSGTTDIPNTVIVGATGDTYQPPSLSVNTWYRKKVVDSDSPAQTAFTNTVKISIYPALSAGIIASAQTIYVNTAPTQLTFTTAPSGGSGQYSYQWYSGITSGATDIITGATGNTYQPPNLTGDTWYKSLITDTYCSTTANTLTIKITVLGAVFASITGTGISCHDLCDASASFYNQSGGSGTYEYSYDSGATWQTGDTKTDLCAGEYFMSIRDANNTGDTYYCGQLSIINPAEITGTVTVTNCSSYLSNDGDITITNISGGTATWDASINSGATWQSTSGFDSIQYPSLSAGTYTVCLRDSIHNDCIYCFGDFIITQPAPVLQPPFCSGTYYSVSGSTCGNADGKISIVENDYFTYYDFTLTDIDGNSYTFDTITGEATGLTSNYYFLTATVKPAYWYWYGRETCTFEWLEVIDSDTTMSNTSKSVRNVVCGGFGKQQGRIAYLCTDSGSNPIYTAKLYNKDTYDLVQTVTGTTIDLIIFSPLNAGDYYCHITNDAGCSLLIGATKVQGQSLRSVAGIKKLWLTQWDENVEYDYWAQSDDDYYLSGIDADFFNSIKIKRFIDSTLPDVWYSVNVQTKAITFSQTMEKTKQGFVFNDKLALTIPEADNTKWKELVDILQNRYILIFLDNNGYYWCMGYRHGASTDGYKRENNEYILEFNAISENKILTNIDKQYIIDSIL